MFIDSLGNIGLNKENIIVKVKDPTMVINAQMTKSLSNTVDVARLVV